MNNQENNELQRLYETEMADQSAFARGRRALFDDDYEQAQQCFRQAVSEGHAEAMTFLGYMYRKGLGVRRDDAKAAVLYRYNNLGVLFMKGEGVAKNLIKAKELFLQAINFDGSKDSKRHLKELGYGYN